MGIKVNGIEVVNNARKGIFAGIEIAGGMSEQVGTMPVGLTPSIDPANGTIQLWTLTGNSSPTSALTNGQSITLMIDDGTAYTVTWPSVIWVNNETLAPELALVGYTVVVLWVASGVLYGSLAGNGT